jgi:hypothetical protein
MRSLAILSALVAVVHGAAAPAVSISSSTAIVDGISHYVAGTAVVYPTLDKC